MWKKFLTLCVGACCLFTVNQADAYEYGKKVIMKQFKCDAYETLNYANENFRNAISKDKRIYEDDNIKIETFINIGFDNLIISREYRNFLAKNSVILAIGGNKMMGFNTYIYVAPAVTFRITNKTDQPMEFDLDHSQITVCSYQGRGVQAGTKYSGAATSLQAPVMIFPKATKEVTLWRTDHEYYDSYAVGSTTVVSGKWLPPFDVKTDINLLGDTILCINKKYITYTPEAVVDSSKLLWKQIKK